MENEMSTGDQEGNGMGWDGMMVVGSTNLIELNPIQVVRRMLYVGMYV